MLCRNGQAVKARKPISHGLMNRYPVRYCFAVCFDGLAMGEAILADGGHWFAGVFLHFHFHWGLILGLFKKLRRFEPRYQ